MIRTRINAFENAPIEKGDPDFARAPRLYLKRLATRAGTRRAAAQQGSPDRLCQILQSSCRHRSSRFLVRWLAQARIWLSRRALRLTRRVGHALQDPASTGLQDFEQPIPPPPPSPPPLPSPKGDIEAAKKGKPSTPTAKVGQNSPRAERLAWPRPLNRSQRGRRIHMPDSWKGSSATRPTPGPRRSTSLLCARNSRARSSAWRFSTRTLVDIFGHFCTIGGLLYSYGGSAESPSKLGSAGGARPGAQRPDLSRLFPVRRRISSVPQ